MKIKSLTLKNFCGYEDAHFDFLRKDGTPKPVCAFYGPNGCGKSTALEAIEMLGNIRRYMDRENDLLFRKLEYHSDYDPSLPHYQSSEKKMTMSACFVDEDGREYTNTMTSEGAEEGSEFDGILSAELTDSYVTCFIDADNQINVQKFQLPDVAKKDFLDIATVVYGYTPTVDKSIFTIEDDEEILFWQDLIIEKGKTKVHYKRMSAGEKKIATLLRSICNPYTTRDSEVLLVDNIEMHVYFERHGKMMDKILEICPGKQFIVTSHSGDMLKHIGENYGEDCLFNVPEIKNEPMNDV